MISIAWISLPPDTLRRMVDAPTGTSRGRRWERFGALGVFGVIAALGLIAALFTGH